MSLKEEIQNIIEMVLSRSDNFNRLVSYYNIVDFTAMLELMKNEDLFSNLVRGQSRSNPDQDGV